MREKRRPGEREDISQRNPRPRKIDAAGNRAASDRADPWPKLEELSEVLAGVLARLERLECKHPWPKIIELSEILTCVLVRLEKLESKQLYVGDPWPKIRELSEVIAIVVPRLVRLESNWFFVNEHHTLEFCSYHKGKIERSPEPTETFPSRESPSNEV